MKILRRLFLFYFSVFLNISFRAYMLWCYNMLSVYYHLDFLMLMSSLFQFSGRLKGERDKVEEVIRGEFSERLVTLEEENKNAKSELIECKTRHKFEFERQGRLHEDEMGEVNVMKHKFSL